MKINYVYDFRYMFLFVVLKLMVFNCINLLFICSFIGINLENNLMISNFIFNFIKVW